MKGIVVLLCALTTVVARTTEDYFNAYGYTKAMTNCFGDEAYYGRLASFIRAEEQCMQLPLTDLGFANFPGGSGPPPGVFQGQGFPQGVGGFPGQQQVFVSRTGRQVQQGPLVDRSYVENAIFTAYSALSNFTCQLRAIGAIDESFNINSDLSEYYSIPLDPALRDDLIAGSQFCQELVKCLPLEILKSPMPPALQRLVVFVKCERKSRLKACYKHDIRQKLHLFDISALPAVGGQADAASLLAAIFVGEGATDDLELY